MLLGMIEARPTPAHRARRTVVTVLMLGAGLALLIWMVRRLDLKLADVQAGFSAIGFWFIAIIVLSFLRFLLRAKAWIVLTGARIPLSTAVAAVLSGDTVGNVTPLLGLAASEPAKTFYLRHHADPAATLAALVAENFFYSVSVAIYVSLAAGSMLFFFDLPAAVRLSGVIALSLMALVLAGATWIAWRKPTLASTLVGRIPIARLRALAIRLRAFERQMYGSAVHEGSRLGVVAACEAGFHLLSLIECWLTFWLLTGVTDLLPALVFDGFNRVVNIVAKPIPGRIGVEESGTALLAGAIGLSEPGGFMLALVRKVRVLAWTVLGLGLWIRNSRTGPPER